MHYGVLQMNEVKHWWLYVLKLEGGKYYVGITSQTPEIRMNEHIHHVRSANWTRQYKPIKLHDTHDLGVVTKEKAELYEARVTRRYMKEYGINNVRGGDLTEVDNYTARFGRIFLPQEWQALTMVVFLTMIIIILAANTYLG
jgi:predicted GIY-YIG superfamily endonuclease